MGVATQPRVAVIGLGAQGLVAVKNLLEENFSVTGFEKKAYVGGIWHFSAKAGLSALPTTVVNVSRQRACFTDFPFPDSAPSFPDAAAMDQYLNAYADHFHLRPHLRIETAVLSVKHNGDHDTWSIRVLGPQADAPTELTFDKLVVAVGPHDKPLLPEIRNSHIFSGPIEHSITFKDPSVYADKRVLVVGASNTAADTCTSLANVAKTVYLAHRHGAIVLPRVLKDGSALDHKLTYRHGVINDWLSSACPSIAQKLGDMFVAHLSNNEHGTLDPRWRIAPAPSLLHQVPTVTDTLIPLLRSGEVMSCHAPASITGPQTVELQDGGVLEVDCIICCTGYSMDLSILGSADPTLNVDGSRDYVTPRLYQNVFSLKHPQSLAFVGYATMSQPAALLADLTTMAIAQIWSNDPGSPALPPQADMEQWYRTHLEWVGRVRALSPDNKFVKLSVHSGLWMDWIEEVTEHHVQDLLGYFSIRAWIFWVLNMGLVSLLMGGVWTPHMYRLFDSKRRKKWDQAEEVIREVNRNKKPHTAATTVKG